MAIALSKPSQRAKEVDRTDRWGEVAMCYRVKVEADCRGGVRRQKLAHLATMLGPEAIGVKGTPDSWTAVLHFHADSAENAKSMALMRVAAASCNAHLPAPVCLTCEAKPEVDRPRHGRQNPFLLWSPWSSSQPSFASSIRRTPSTSA